MLRRSAASRYKTPKNMGVAPRYDHWNEKYEPWEHMKRMGRLVGTGFYIPPEWYNHFRMFPPINHNFQQEKTLNPHNHSEPTGDVPSSLSQKRLAIREELAKKSRLLASEGMRYYNLFWVRKPLDRMEQQYFELSRKGVEHSTALKRVLESFYSEITAKKRVAAIQAEEAKLSGKYISMREAVVVMGILSQLQREHFSPNQAALLAKVQRERARDADGFSAVVTSETEERGGAGTAASEVDAAGGYSPDLLAGMLAEDSGAESVIPKVDVHVTECDSVNRLRDRATDSTGDTDWYTGESPFLNMQGEGK